MKKSLLVLALLFSLVSFAQSPADKSFPPEELFALGSYYYPEQWDSSQWERDLKKMSEMGIKFTHFAEFAWAMMEPEEGKYDFEWLDRAVSLAEKYGLKVIMCTPKKQWALCPMHLVEQKEYRWEICLFFDKIRSRVTGGCFWKAAKL